MLTTKYLLFVQQEKYFSDSWSNLKFETCKQNIVHLTLKQLIFADEQILGP